MLQALFRAMRPRQWAKNVFVFAGLFFDGKAFSPTLLLRSIGAFAIFSLISSAVYLVNDVADIESDRQHPTKRNRPLASGALSKEMALGAAAIILVVLLPVSFLIDVPFGLVALAYVALMFLYTFVLKHIVIIDVMSIAAGFVLRVLAGTLIVHVSRFSPWLYLCTTFLALFIALNKRRHELVLLAGKSNEHRTVLDSYSLEFIDQATSVVTAATLAAYSFYTFSAPYVPFNHAMMLTIPFVLYGIFRYLYVVHVQHLGGSPEDVVLHDRPLILDVVLWIMVAALVIYTPIFR